MPVFHPEDLRRWTGGHWNRLPAETAVTGFSNDSRQLSPGDCFVAIRTEQRDGHEFLNAAWKQGASSALVAREDEEVAIPQLVVEDPLEALRLAARGHRRQFSGTVIGITGSCGKTSTKDLLAGLLGDETTLATKGNLNNQIGLPLTLLRLDAERHSCAVVEAGINHRGEMSLLADCLQPDMAIVTMLSPAHLEGLGSMEQVAEEKSILLQGVSRPGNGYFPASCLEHRPFRVLAEKSSVLFEENASGRNGPVQRRWSYAAALRPGLPGSLALRIPNGPAILFQMDRASPGMIRNAALAAAVALDLGVHPSLIRTRLASWRPTENRGQILEGEGQSFYVDCYNANPASVEDAIEAFSHAFKPELPRLYVLATMNELGERAALLHREVGRRVPLRSGDAVLFIGRHAEDYLVGFRENNPAPGSFRVYARTEDAMAAVSFFRGAILLKGSREYRLEQLIPPGVEQVEKEENTTAC